MSQNTTETHDKLLFFFGSIMLAAAFISWILRINPYPDNSQILPQLSTDPLQEAIDLDPITFERKGNTYKIIPLYNYDLHGLVVSKREDSFQHKVFYSDHVNEADLCVIWGDNIDNNIHKEMKFRNSTWFCSWKAKKASDWNKLNSLINNEALSNNHLLSNSNTVRKKISNVSVGDQIRIRGYLSKYSTNNGPERGTSTTRSDTGDGACETIFVDNFEILQKGNPVSDFFAEIAKIALFLTLTVIFLYKNKLQANTIRTGSYLDSKNTLKNLKNTIPPKAPDM